MRNVIFSKELVLTQLLISDGVSQEISTRHTITCEFGSNETNAHTAAESALREEFHSLHLDLWWSRFFPLVKTVMA